MVFIPPARSLLLRFGSDPVPLLKIWSSLVAFSIAAGLPGPGKALSLALGPGKEMALLVSGTLPAPAALP